MIWSLFRSGPAVHAVEITAAGHLPCYKSGGIMYAGMFLGMEVFVIWSTGLSVRALHVYSLLRLIGA